MTVDTYITIPICAQALAHTHTHLISIYRKLVSTQKTATTASGWSGGFVSPLRRCKSAMTDLNVCVCCICASYRNGMTCSL